VAVIGCHESNSVEPVLDNSAQLNRLDEVNGALGDSFKFDDMKREIFLCEYNFNPEARNEQCGGFLNGSSLEYTYIVDSEIDENFKYRYVYDVQLYSPSKIVIGNKRHNTCNIYTVNRMEKVTLAGKVVSGKTWGTFKIVLYKGTVPDKSNVVLFEGEFTGEIEFKTTRIKLTAEGQRSYNKRYLIADEEQICGASTGRCWTSNMKGSISPRVETED